MLSLILQHFTSPTMSLKLDVLQNTLEGVRSIYDNIAIIISNGSNIGSTK